MGVWREAPPSRRHDRHAAIHTRENLRRHESGDWGIAVAAHAGTPASVTRASEAGVISIENGMLRDPERNVLVIIKDSEIHKNALRSHGTP
jgi:hypothetical protein